MAFYCQNMIEMALILADYDSQYEEYAFKFLQNFMWIAYYYNRRFVGRLALRARASRQVAA
jgi:hypothetical protein